MGSVRASHQSALVTGRLSGGASLADIYRQKGKGGWGRGRGAVENTARGGRQAGMIVWHKMPGHPEGYSQG